MELDRSTVHRNLDASMKIGGLELFDLLGVLLLAAVMNLVFGKTNLSFWMVFVLPSTTGLILYFGKRNKPENYLKHLIRYLVLPGAFASGNTSTKEQMMRRNTVECQ